MPLPDFWKSRIEDIDACLAGVRKGRVEQIATSPGGRNVSLVSFGRRGDLDSLATYNSACGAGNPAWYARKPAGTPPTVVLLGPVHGHEVEGVVGLVNLINIVETGSDLRGKPWSALAEAFGRCHVLIVPCANPDGRARCEVDSFVGADHDFMAHWGQGSRADGTDYGWPAVKTRMPMTGDVGLLGGYHNDDGINFMHDNFFAPMAEETAALLRVASAEAPDYICGLHSHGWQPRPLPVAWVPRFIKDKLHRFKERLADRYEAAGLPFRRDDRAWVEAVEGAASPAPSFNLVSALHHACGAMSFCFECPHGIGHQPYPRVDHGQILDIQLLLYEELLAFALDNPVIWERD
jgi:hypothetical protein